jgi:hypothetical protein
MSAEILRQVLGNQQAAQQATREAQAITAQAYSESNATIRTLESRVPAKAEKPPQPEKK